MKRTCKECKAWLVYTDAKFCHKCGSKVEETAEEKLAAMEARIKELEAKLEAKPEVVVVNKYDKFNQAQEERKKKFHHRRTKEQVKEDDKKIVDLILNKGYTIRKAWDEVTGMLPYGEIYNRYNKLVKEQQKKSTDGRVAYLKEINRIAREEILDKTIPVNMRRKEANKIYMARKYPMMPHETKLAGVVLSKAETAERETAVRQLSVEEAIKKFPRIEMLEVGMDGLLEGLLSAVIKNTHYSLKWDIEGKALGIEFEKWNEFCTEFFFLADKFANYFGVQNKFKVKNNMICYSCD